MTSTIMLQLMTALEVGTGVVTVETAAHIDQTQALNLELQLMLLRIQADVQARTGGDS